MQKSCQSAGAPALATCSAAVQLPPGQDWIELARLKDFTAFRVSSDNIDPASNDDAAVRALAALALRGAGKPALPALAQLRAALQDSGPAVRRRW